MDSIPIVKDSFTLLKDKFIAQIRIGKRKALSKKPSMRTNRDSYKLVGKLCFIAVF